MNGGSEMRVFLRGCLVFCVILGAAATPALGGGYDTPSAGRSPHGSYSDVTDKCKVCHAAHNANASAETSYSPPQVLLRTRRGMPTGQAADVVYNGAACAYCHISASWSIKKIYGGLLSNYRSDSRYNHDDYHRGNGFGQITIDYAGCMSCHSVHGANLVPGYEAKIVSADPNPDFDAITVTNLTDFCRDCHEDTTPSSGGKWGYNCYWCHNGFGTRDQRPPFYLQSRDGVTHIMTTTLTGNYGTQVAWTDSSDCEDCHMGGNHTINNSFPHYTSGAQFLDDGYNPAATGMDRVCLNCHAEGGDGGSYTTGVGKTF